VNWQVKYALANISEQPQLTAEYMAGELIRIVAQNQPDVLAVISDAHTINPATAVSYCEQYPGMDFLCG
jgi:hypothetical protein